MEQTNINSVSVSQPFKELIQIPTILSAQFVDKNISCLFSSKRISTNKKIYSTQYFINSDNKFIALPSAENKQSLISSLIQNDYRLDFYSNTDSELYVDICKHKPCFQFIKTVSLNNISKLYFSPFFGLAKNSCSFSPDDRSVVFVGEPATEKTSYWKNNVDTTNNLIGIDHLYRENFGELLTNTYSPSLYLLELDNCKVIKLETKLDYSFGQPLFISNNEIVCIGFPNELDKRFHRKLGLSFCNNRISYLFYFKLSEKDHSVIISTMINLKFEQVMCILHPRLSNSGDYLVFTARTYSGIHFASSALYSVSISELLNYEKKSVHPNCLVPVVDNEINYRDSFPGLYFRDVPPLSCFLKDNRIVLPSQYYSNSAIFLIETDYKNNSNVAPFAAKNIKRLVIPSSFLNFLNEKYPIGTKFTNESVSLLLLDVFEDLIIAILSSLSSFECLVMVKFDSLEPSFELVYFPQFNLSPPLQKTLSSIKTEIIPISIDNKTVFEVLLLYSTEYSNCRGLIVNVHGGPHSVHIQSYNYPALFFVHCGFALMFINYRGTIGSGEYLLNSLVSKCGIQDVSDCVLAIDITRQYLSKLFSIDFSEIPTIIQGGSHGGFLTVKLIEEYPDKFIAGAARNPVINFTKVKELIDIPDWLDSVLPKTDILSLYNYSLNNFNFASLVEKSIKLPPLLLGIGMSDNRVDPSNAIELFRILKHYQFKTKLLSFPNVTHSLDNTPQTEGDWYCNCVEWYYDAMKK